MSLLKKLLVSVAFLPCAFQVLTAQIPKEYKGKPFKDKFYKLGAQPIPGRIQLAVLLPKNWTEKGEKDNC
jgi:hypothetical protein